MVCTSQIISFLSKVVVRKYSVSAWQLENSGRRHLPGLWRNQRSWPSLHYPISRLPAGFAQGRLQLELVALLWLCIFQTSSPSSGAVLRPKFSPAEIAPPRASSLSKTMKNIYQGSDYWYSEFVHEVLSRYIGPGNYLLIFSREPINVTLACIQTKYDSGVPRLHAWFALGS